MILVGRENERSMLLNAYSSFKPEFAVVYGRRRVGKTYLVDATFDGKYAFRHSALPPATDVRQSEMSPSKSFPNLHPLRSHQIKASRLRMLSRLRTLWIRTPISRSNSIASRIMAADPRKPATRRDLLTATNTLDTMIQIIPSIWFLTKMGPITVTMNLAMARDLTTIRNIGPIPNSIRPSLFRATIMDS